MIRQLAVSFKLGAVIREDSQTDCFVSYCPAIDIYSAGRNRIEAKKALTSAAGMYVRHCYQRGILDLVLREKGFSASSTLMETSNDVEQFIAVQAVRDKYEHTYDDVFDLDIPLHLIAQKKEHMKCLQ